MSSIEAPFDGHRAVVLPEWIDYNGHMNVAYYLLAFDHASDSFFDALGLDAAHRDATGGSTFAADIHLTYQREVKEGDPLRITSQLLGFDDKRLRFFQRMYHAEEGFLSATMESLSLYVDLNRRRVTTFPEAIRDRLAAVFAAHRALPLPPEAGRVIAKPPLPERSPGSSSGAPSGSSPGSSPGPSLGPSSGPSPGPRP
ncbi:MAG: thioesterase family protein [Kiloniellaceae bacterium]